METRRILLGKNKHKRGVNEDNFVGVELNEYSKVLPYTEDSYNVDSYIQYFREKDASDKFRLSFTLAPFCSNVLFNVITEPVFKEGSDDCLFVGKDNVSNNPFISYNNRPLNRTNAIRDTGYSHPKVGPLVYHCGYDIFNNHFLRKKEFSIVNFSNNKNNEFNTLNDKLRTRFGDTVKDSLLEITHGTDRLNKGNEQELHLYQFDTVNSYSDSVYNNLVENNGWFGFLNATTLPIDNWVGPDGKKYSINKCMNNNKAWEQIDMYPDRSLYSFVPKINKFRGRIEKNWDYCITYPAGSTTANDIVENQELGINGLKCKIVTVYTSAVLENENTLITFKSFLRHNLHAGEYVTLSFVENGSNERKTANPVKVVGVGGGYGDTDHYFTVRFSSIMNEMVKIPSGRDQTVKGVKFPSDFSEIRFRKYEGGTEAKYYIRIFEKIDSLSSSLNKLAFSQNVYSDQVAQIVFTEDINTSAMKDNLGRQISELYLTIVKRNQGYEEWYKNKHYSGDDIEFSHCFGEVTSGFDMPADDECRDYNIHRIHSVGFNVPSPESAMVGRGITPSPEKLETGITIDNHWFFGDIVEFSLSRIEETVISEVYHRFNTAQREAIDDEFGSFTYDDIIHDDYDIGESGGKNGERFENSAVTFGRDTMINLVPEGYFYKPHYKVRVRSFEEEVQQGNHIKVSYGSATGSGKMWTLETSVNYYFEKPFMFYRDPDDGLLYTEQSEGNTRTPVGEEQYRSEVVAYRMVEGEAVERMHGVCIDVEGDLFNVVTLKFDENIDLNNGNWVIFRKNTEEPLNSYELNDGTGRYLWRNVLSYSDMMPDDDLYNETFTNGAHYFHKNIMFYLKRQDPTGEYGIGDEPEDVTQFFSVSGKTKDVSVAEYVSENEGTIC